MLFYFAVFCSCEWRNFNPNDYDSMLKSSYTTPLFLLAFSATCPYCRGLPEKFEKFGKTYDGNVIVSTVNCSDFMLDHYCDKLGVRGYPTILYIPSESREFWRTDHRRTPDEWKVFLDIMLTKRVQNGLDTISNHEDKAMYEPSGKSIVGERDLDAPETDGLTENDQRMIEKSLKMGSPVLAVIESEENSMYGIVESDIQIIKGRGSKDHVTLYLSSECKFEFDSPEATNQFIADNSHYGHMHKFTYNEWKSVSDIAILFVQNNPNSTELEILNLMSRELCGKFAVGWAPIGKSFKIMAEILTGDQSQSFIGITNNDCVYLYRNAEFKHDAVESFLTNVKAATEKCLLRPERRVTKPELPQTQVRKYGDGKTLLILSPIVLLAVISFVVLQRRPVKKNE